MRAWRLAPILLAALAILGACAPASSPEPLPPFAVRAGLPDGGVAVARNGSRRSLYLTDGTTGVREATSSEDAGDHVTVHLVAFGGETGLATNSFAFGQAPPTAVTLEVAPGQVVAAIRQGVFVAALAPRDVTPAQLAWTFRDGAGLVVAEGTGIRD